MQMQTDSSFDLDNFLPYQLAVVAGRASKAFAEIYSAEAGLTVPEWRIMAHLLKAEAVSVREIHLRTDLDKPKVSRASDRLEAEGLLVKKVNPRDRRLVELSLTPAGRALMMKLIPLANQFQQKLLEQLGGDAAAFRAALSRMMDDSK